MNKIRTGYFYPWHRPLNWFRNLKCLFASIKIRFLRGRYGVTYYDSWDLDSYLLQVLENGLETFKGRKWGHPAKLTAEEWDNILNRMFELVKIIQIEGIECEEAEKYYDHDMDQWYKEAQKWEEYRQECLEELCDLMKEWFFDLWD